MYEVIGYRLNYPDEDIIILFSGSLNECEDFLFNNQGAYEENGMTYQLEIWEVDEDEKEQTSQQDLLAALQRENSYLKQQLSHYQMINSQRDKDDDSYLD